MHKTLVAAAAVAAAIAGFALAAPQKDTFNLTANLRARSEVPKPSGVPAAAVGLFTAKAVELDNNRARVTWRLTFSKLSGRAVAAHIHTGRAGRAGGVMAPLCGPCRSGQRGIASITHAQLRVIRRGGAYVNVHTPKNPAGEIRGQVKASETSSSSSTTSPPTETTPEPPPYP